MSESTQKKGLGRGFDSLLPSNFDSSLLSGVEERIQRVKIHLITPNTEQPRSHFDEAALKELAESIKKHGILQPLVVTKHSDSYQLVAGERRLRAAKLIDLKDVPVIVRTAAQLERLEMALIENIQRVNLSPLEQASSIERLHQQFSLSYDQIAKQLGKALSTISNSVRLLQLPPEALKALADKVISEGHARQILALKTVTEQGKLLRLIKNHHWSVRQAEDYVKAAKSLPGHQPADHTKISTPFTYALSKKLNTTVAIKRGRKGGYLQIRFSSDKQLEDIFRLLD